MWAKFSSQEMTRRWSLARDLMRRGGLVGLLLFGNSGVNRHNQANVFWLSNHLDLHHNYLIAPLDESIEPAMYVGLANHLPAAREVCDLPIVDWGGYDPAATVAGRLRAVKSPEEIAWLRRAAEFTDRTIYALRDQVRPGMPEYALLGIIEGAYRADGGLQHIAFVRSMPMDDPSGCVPAQNPSERVLRLHAVPFEPIVTTQ